MTLSLKRIPAVFGVIACVLFYTAVAMAAAKNAHTAAPGGTVSGTVTAIDGSLLTVQTSGRRTGAINALTTAANAVTKGDYPYVWGGGHALAGVASVGIKGGPGANGRRVGFDCSGSVAAVLAGAGLWPAGGSVPSDSGVIAQLLAQGLIARGAGATSNSVTLYDNPGVHIFMNIDGRFFGTSDGGGGGNPKGGAGWLYDGAYDATDRAFKQYHFLPAVLKDKSSYGHIYTFNAGAAQNLTTTLAVGAKVKVTYVTAGNGTLNATAIGDLGTVTVTAAVASLAADRSSFTVQTAGGSTIKVLTAGNSSLLNGVVPGDNVRITYSSKSGSHTARVLTLLAAPTLVQAAGIVTAITADGSSMTLSATGGQLLTISTGGVTSLVSSLADGDGVQVSYVKLPNGTLVAQSIAGTAAGSTGGASSTGAGNYGGGASFSSH